MTRERILVLLMAFLIMIALVVIFVMAWTFMYGPVRIDPQHLRYLYA